MPGKISPQLVREVLELTSAGRAIRSKELRSPEAARRVRKILEVLQRLRGPEFVPIRERPKGAPQRERISYRPEDRPLGPLEKYRRAPPTHKVPSYAQTIEEMLSPVEHALAEAEKRTKGTPPAIPPKYAVSEVLPHERRYVPAQAPTPSGYPTGAEGEAYRAYDVQRFEAGGKRMRRRTKEGLAEEAGTAEGLVPEIQAPLPALMERSEIKVPPKAASWESYRKIINQAQRTEWEGTQGGLPKVFFNNVARPHAKNFWSYGRSLFDDIGFHQVLAGVPGEERPAFFSLVSRSEKSARYRLEEISGQRQSWRVKLRREPLYAIDVGARGSPVVPEGRQRFPERIRVALQGIFDFHSISDPTPTERAVTEILEGVGVKSQNGFRPGAAREIAADFVNHAVEAPFFEEIMPQRRTPPPSTYSLGSGPGSAPVRQLFAQMPLTLRGKEYQAGEAHPVPDALLGYAQDPTRNTYGGLAMKRRVALGPFGEDELRRAGAAGRAGGRGKDYVRDLWRALYTGEIPKNRPNMKAHLDQVVGDISNRLEKLRGELEVEAKANPIVSRLRLATPEGRFNPDSAAGFTYRLARFDAGQKSPEIFSSGPVTKGYMRYIGRVDGARAALTDTEFPTWRTGVENYLPPDAQLDYALRPEHRTGTTIQTPRDVRINQAGVQRLHDNLVRVAQLDPGNPIHEIVLSSVREGLQQVEEGRSWSWRSLYQDIFHRAHADPRATPEMRALQMKIGRGRKAQAASYSYIRDEVSRVLFGSTEYRRTMTQRLPSLATFDEAVTRFGQRAPRTQPAAPPSPSPPVPTLASEQRQALLEIPGLQGPKTKMVGDVPVPQLEIPE